MYELVFIQQFWHPEQENRDHIGDNLLTVSFVLKLRWFGISPKWCQYNLIQSNLSCVDTYVSCVNQSKRAKGTRIIRDVKLNLALIPERAKPLRRGRWFLPAELKWCCWCQSTECWGWAPRELRWWRVRSRQPSLSKTEHLTAPRHYDGRQCLPRPRTAFGVPEKAQRSVRRVRRGCRRIYSGWALRGPRSTVRPRRWSKNLSWYNHPLISLILACLSFNSAEHFCTLHLTVSRINYIIHFLQICANRLV